MKKKSKLFSAPNRVGPKVLIYDIETSPILAHVFGIWGVDIRLDQIENDWHVMSWAAKWLGDSSKKIMYRDQSRAKDLENDTELLREMWELLDEADIVITHNGKKFDSKKLNARFVINGFKPPSSYKHIDTLTIARKVFGFTSNKLEYLNDKLNSRFKKSKHRKFHGITLWKECLKGNKEAWDEMRRYNIMDVLALEETYSKLIPWDNTINFNLYRSDGVYRCKCGSTDFKKKGFQYNRSTIRQRYQCVKCGCEHHDPSNQKSGVKTPHSND